jgi:hypothetical protein
MQGSVEYVSPIAFDNGQWVEVKIALGSRENPSLGEMSIRVPAADRDLYERGMMFSITAIPHADQQ